MEKNYNLNNNTTDIYSAFQLCRSGNNNAVSNLFTDTLIENTNPSLDNEINFKTSDVGLAKMINKCYNDMTTPVKYAKEDPNHWTKYSASKFTGSKEDMTCIFANETFKLFKNPDFNPTSETDIYNALKVNVGIEVNRELREKDTFKEISSTVVSDDMTFDDDDDGTLPPELCDDCAFQDWLDNQNTDNDPYCAVDSKVSGKNPKEKIKPTYTYFMRESAEFVKNNLKNALPDNATAKKNLIDLLKEVYDYRTDDKGKIAWITQKAVEYIYKQKYGKSTNMSDDLDAFFEILASRIFGYIPTKRDKFKIAEKNEENPTPSYNYHVMLSDESTSYIDGVITGKIKNVDRGLYNYYYDNMLYSINKSVFDFNKKGCELDVSEILYYVNHQYDDPEDDEKPKKEKELYWNLTVKKNQVVIDFYKRCYKHCESNAYNLQKNTQIILPGIPDIYLFGNCTVLVMPTTNECLYFASEKRLPYVLRRGSRFYSF